MFSCLSSLHSSCALLREEREDAFWNRLEVCVYVQAAIKCAYTCIYYAVSFSRGPPRQRAIVTAMMILTGFDTTRNCVYTHIGARVQITRVHRSRVRELLRIRLSFPDSEWVNETWLA